MEDLIKREDAIALTATFIELNKFKMHNVKDAGRLSHALFSESRIPSADAVEVVRCKECKRQGSCARLVVFSEIFGEIEDAEIVDFCSYGEKK